jgi:hypothetical protein
MTYNPSDIFTDLDIKRLTETGIIQNDIVIRGEHLQQLSDVQKINGFLGISDSSLESLGELREITGDFWMSSHAVFSRLTTLGNLEKVGGDLSLRYSNIIDLGKLKKVGGKLSLRDTAIDDLGVLEYVGGDLYLPKKLQDSVDLSHVVIKGKIRFWNNSKTQKNIIPKEELGLLKHSDAVPHWEHKYIFSASELNNANPEQRKFYNTFKQKFKEGLFLDIEGNENYAFVLFYDLLSSSKGDIHELQADFKNLENHYPKTKNYTQSAVIQKMEAGEDFNGAWNLKYKEPYIRVETITEYEKKLNRQLLDGELMVKLAGISHLTNFGQNNIESIKPFANEELKKLESREAKQFFELFFQDELPYKKAQKSSNKKGFFRLFGKESSESQVSYDVEYYQQFYVSNAEFLHYKAIDDSQIKLNPNPRITHVIEKAIFNQCRVILKHAEDLYREAIGMPKIGEGWISETELFYKVSDSFPEHEVKHHASPKWLGRQHLDIYLPELNIGLEYQGAQHYVAVEFFGGEEGLAKTIERDKKKKQKCLENGCHLIYVDEGYKFEDVKDKITEISKNGAQHSVIKSWRFSSE